MTQGTTSVGLVLGVVFAPALGCLYAGLVGHGAWREDRDGRRAIRCRTAPATGLDVVVSRSHGDPAALQKFLTQHQVASVVAPVNRQPRAPRRHVCATRPPSHIGAARARRQ